MYIIPIASSLQVNLFPVGFHNLVPASFLAMLDDLPDSRRRFCFSTHFVPLEVRV